METRLFTNEQVRKFFEKLDKQSRHSLDLYKGYDKNNPHVSKCGKEVFVNRTLNRWLNGKHLIWYAVSEQLDIQYQRYISISHVRFALGYSTDISVYFFDYGRPLDLFNEVSISHNDALMLEGVWCDDDEKHLKLAKLTNLNIPPKEYVFRRNDWSKYPKKTKDKDSALRKIQTTISFVCKTEFEAYKAVKKSEFAHEIYELLEVKEVQN